MTNEVIPWSERLKAEAKDVAEKYNPTVGRISLRGGIMVYDGNPVPNNTLECIVVANVFENQFYDRAFDPDDTSPPECYALSATGASMKPHEAVEEPVSALCEGCPNLEWGSDQTRPNARGKACKEKVRLALLPVSALKDVDAVKSSEVALVTIPVTSVKNWANYVRGLSAGLGRPPWSVVTRVEVKPNQKTQFSVIFAHTQTVTGDELLEALDGRKAGMEKMLLEPYKVEEEEPAVTAKPGKKQKF